MYAVAVGEPASASPDEELPLSPSGGRRPPSADGDSERRRKIRKGTRSCWECKRRKVRCTFASDADQVCDGCRRRGTKCVGQEFPEEASGPAERSRQMGDRIVRVEGLVEQLVKTVGAGRSSLHDSIGAAAEGSSPVASSRPSPHPTAQTPSSTGSAPRRGGRVVALSLPAEQPPEASNSAASARQGWQVSTKPHTLFIPTHVSPANAARYEAISAALRGAYPSRGDLDILKRSELGSMVFAKHLVMTPYPVLEREGLIDPGRMFDPPKPGSHPVIIARCMLRMATFLQYYNPDLSPHAKHLSRKPLELTQTLADAVIRLVTTNDEFLGTIEGLDCVMLEGIYQGNCGNLRRAWLAVRRAMVVAQLMGIHRNCQHRPLKSIDPDTVAYPYYIWSRIVFTDRVLSMMLGLPQGSLDYNIASPAALADDTPLGRLERMHSLISSKILERNEAGLIDDYATTEAIDLKLQEAAQQLPAKWWLAPNLSEIGANLEGQFWGTLKLLAQLFHYHLLNYLHLPYMLRSTQGEKEMAHKYEYSKVTCVTAAREMLIRFIVFRTHNRVAYCGRTVDFYALMAAMTLLVAHLDGHRQPKGNNTLAHQRLADRAMMEDVLENIESVKKHSGDKLSEKSERLLRRLLEIEAEAAEGRRSYQTTRLQDNPDAGLSGQANDEKVLRIPVPYFGTVTIAPDGVMCEASSHQVQVRAPRHTVRIQNPDGGCCEVDDPDTFGVLREDSCGTGTVFPPVSVDHEAEMADGELPPMVQNQSLPPREQQQHSPPPRYPQQDTTVLPASQPEHFAPNFPEAVTEAMHQYDYPGLTAGADDWTFQGVDLTFFDTLMRGANTMDVTGDGEGGDWGGQQQEWRQCE
ncbi:hypothetical protein QBC47DRAFT_4963 [Echria macrotheca]|uniref:Zn(2)-C6 fungal-type domain-containing protein n=1 Tax=Echria macrotheca TaxID=438768 RepID=A0AAJ0FGT0_9PEZI|nr:hypothetical protein QBC47DRAFT_4963 [Echria macrotheca]